MAELIHRSGNKWRVRVFCRRDEHGKKIFCYNKTHTFETIKERNSFANRKQQEHEDGTLHDRPEKLTLDRHLDDWLEHKRGKLDPNTHADYKETLERYVRTELGDVLLTDLKPRLIQKLYDGMTKQGLTARTVRYTHTILRSALEKAVWWDLIPTNPANRTERPSGSRKKIGVMMPDEAARFLESAKEDRLAALFYLALANGPRPEESFGLQWPDVNLEKGRIEIQRVLISNRTGGGWRLRDMPKTDSGFRTLTLEPEVIEILQEHRKRQLLERVGAGKRYQNNNLVFATPTGEPLRGSNVLRRSLRPVLERAELNPAFHLYTLRHSFATLSLAARVDAKSVSYALGHKSVAFTLDTYVHIVDSMLVEASGKLGSLLFKKTGS